MSYTVTGTATRVHFHDARRHFEAGGEVVVSEYGEQLEFDVTASTTTHTKESTTWADLVEQVRMWKGRYPNQRYYVVTRPEPEAVDNEGHTEGAAHTIGTRGDAAGTEVCARCDVEWPCDFAADPTPAEDLDEKVRAVLDMLGECATDVGSHFTCTEAEMIADLFRAMGDDDGAAHWIDAHAEDDEEGDDHYKGDDLDPDTCASVLGLRSMGQQFQCGAEQVEGTRYCLTHQHRAADDHPDHTECADGCGLAVTHVGACLDKPGGRVVCDHDDDDDDPDPIPADAERGAASLIREGDAVIVYVAAGPTGNGFKSGRVTEVKAGAEHYGSPALMVSLDNGAEHVRHIVMETAVTYWTGYHDARPDDDNEPGDRCKDCGRDVTWIGPSHTDWQHAVVDAAKATA